LFSVFVFVFLTLAVLQYDQNAEEGVSNLVYLSKREKQTCKVREKKRKSDKKKRPGVHCCFARERITASSGQSRRGEQGNSTILSKKACQPARHAALILRKHEE
jgi:hypothetical protein